MAHCVGTRGLRRTPCRGFTLMLAESHMAIKPAQERDTPAVSLPQLTLSVRLCDYEDCCRVEKVWQPVVCWNTQD